MPAKSGKSRFALSAPKPALINFDRSEDWLVAELGLDDILRDRIVIPPLGISREITVPQARTALGQFEQDIAQGLAMAKGGAVGTLIIDGGSLAENIITLVTLDDSDNKNNTFRYAGRNAYIRNLFNSLNEAGVNVIWTSKAKSMWVADKKVPNMYVPDCHDDIPFMVDVNIQLVAEPSPDGQLFRGVIGTNAFNPMLVGKAIGNLNWELLMKLLRMPPECADSGDLHPESGESAFPVPERCLSVASATPNQCTDSAKAVHRDFGEVRR